MSNVITQKRLKEVLRYDPESGFFVWIVSNSNRALAGSVAGTINYYGYVTITIDGKKHRAARLAYLYMKGCFPEHEIDHRDRVNHNDKWDNLRDATPQLNVRNRGVVKSNTSGITGIIKVGKRWHARITVSRKSLHLGCFGSKRDAARARWNAEVKHGFPNCNTTSSAFQYLRENRKESPCPNHRII